jgi:hypothetical protein
MIRIDTPSTKRKVVVSKKPLMLIQAAIANSGNSLLIWDMSLDTFPPNSTFGKRYYGIKGPTINLKDRFGNVIPDGTFCESIKISGSASITDALDWALTYTII